jgi:hypothetical protein
MFMTWHALVSFNAFWIHLSWLSLRDINEWWNTDFYSWN